MGFDASMGRTLGSDGLSAMRLPEPHTGSERRWSVPHTVLHEPVDTVLRPVDEWLDMAKDELKIPVAFGSDGTRYVPEDIDDPIKGPMLLADTLFDINVDAIKARKGHHRSEGEWVQPHFSMIGDVEVGAIGRAENDPTHNEILAKIWRQLERAESNVGVATNHPTKKVAIKKSDGTSFSMPDGLELWRCPKGTRYEWKREPETRLWMDAKRYIQPDLLGYDVSRRSAGPKNKAVIIEVIHHHPPELETWQRLVELSTANHVVMFYLCSKAKTTGSKFGRISYPASKTNDPLLIRTTHYLLDGVFHKDGQPFGFHPIHTAEERYHAILNEFDRAKTWMAK